MAASPKLSQYFYTCDTDCTLPAGDAATPPPRLAPTPRRRGFPAGTPRNRLSPQQRQAIIDMLKITPNGAAVTRQFVAAKLGAVTHPTVCTIKREAIKRGEIPPPPKRAP